MTSLKRHDGELQVDNRASGTPIPGWGNTTVGAAPTLGCKHCGGVVVLNPLRTRAREYCRLCDRYICDGCAAVTKKADYVHRTIDDLTDMVTSGRYRIAGGTVCEPILIPTGVIHG